MVFYNPAASVRAQGPVEYPVSRSYAGGHSRPHPRWKGHQRRLLFDSHTTLWNRGGEVQKILGHFLCIADVVATLSAAPPPSVLDNKVLVHQLIMDRPKPRRCVFPSRIAVNGHSTGEILDTPCWVTDEPRP